MPARSSSLAEAYAACEAFARAHYENFPVASRLLPAAMRPHVAAVYGFARIADDLADEGGDPPEARRARLDQWQQRLHRAAREPWDSLPLVGPDGHDVPAVAGSGGAVPRSPDRSAGTDVDRRLAARDELILRAVGHSIRSLDLPIELFDDLVSAFGQDTMATRYTSWCDVLEYCRRSANPVGRLVLRIAGYRDQTLERSSDALCTALQLTNFWQDFDRDWRIGRLYVPAEVMRACGASEDELAADRLSESWARTLEACVAFTRQQFASGRAVCDGVRGRLGLELRFTWLGGMRILDRVPRHRAGQLRHRPTLGVLDAPALAWRALRWVKHPPQPHGSVAR